MWADAYAFYVQGGEYLDIWLILAPSTTTHIHTRMYMYMCMRAKYILKYISVNLRMNIHKYEVEHIER